MRTEISIINAQIGDVVRHMISEHEGRVCGVDCVGPAVLVRWGGAGGPLDVYSVDSPVWLTWALYRDDDAQAVMPLEDTDTVHVPQPSCGHVLMADESGCPVCTAPRELTPIVMPFGPDGDMERSTDRVGEAAERAALRSAAVAKLPWSE